MSYWDISSRSHPEEYGSYDADDDIIRLWLGGIITESQCIRLINHEVIHMAIDSVYCNTSAQQDHDIIDYLECEEFL